MPNQAVVFDKALIQKYDKAGPRYTSYPTAVQFSSEFTEADYINEMELTNKIIPASPLSLYFHLPFCNTVCYYCACNKIVTKDRSKAAPYLGYLYREMAMQSKLLDSDRVVDQLHWGGGTPTFISHKEIETLMSVTRDLFNLKDDDSGEYSIEIDPREVNDDTITLLRGLGFNRMSLGVQDFDPQVQSAVNRIQSEEKTFLVLEQARQQGFKSINFDLIYGLPFQTVESFLQTIDKVLSVKPDRLSIFNYAHLPKLFKPQRRINESDLPHPSVKLEIMQLTIDRLQDAGYIYIGMDHFALPEDELAIAQANHELYRNFQGYSTHSDCDLVSMGVTAISKVGDSFCQNARGMDEYYAQIDVGHLPIYRGLVINQDDKLRRDIILSLICHFIVDIRQIEKAYSIDFDNYFAREIEMLKQMEGDALLEINSNIIKIYPLGKLLIRNICMVFDRYLPQHQQQRFSKVI